jgi:predicted permease
MTDNGTDWRAEVRQRLTEVPVSAERETEIVEELAQDLEQRYADLVSAGMDAGHARQQVLAEVSDTEGLGRNLARVEMTRWRATLPFAPFQSAGRSAARKWFRRTDTHRLGGMSNDVRHGLRVFRSTPGFTIAAVLTLALGVGANTAMFSAVRSLLFRPLPVADADRLVYGFALRDGFDPFATSLLEYAALREARSFTSVGLAARGFHNLVGRADPERLQSARVTAGYLSTLGVSPVLGRSILEADERPDAPPVVTIGYDLWQQRFGGGTGILGEQVTLDDGSYTVVGVLPRGFDMPEGSALWLPMRGPLDTLPLEQRAINGYQLVARLAPGVTLEQADAEAKQAATRLEEDFSQFRRGWSYGVVPLRQQLLGDLEGRHRRALLALEAAVACLLLLCCANIANLLLVRGVAREREIAVRIALGASRGRLLRQLLTESACLAAAGGAVGLLLAVWLAPILRLLNPVQTTALSAFLTDFRVDRGVVLFAFCVSAGTSLLFGIVPARTTVRAGSTMAALRRKSGGATSRRLLGALVVAELAIAVLLLVNGSLIVQSFTRLQRVDLGFDPDGLLTAQLTLSSERYDTHAEREAFVNRVIEAVRSVPRVVDVGLTTNIPLQTLSIDAVYGVEGRPPADVSHVPITAHRLVTATYLQTLGVRLNRGRLFNEFDRAGALPVVVVTKALAAEAWPGEDPIGKRVRRVRRQQADPPWMTVVGVVADVKEDRFNFRSSRPAWYLPYAQDSASTAPLNLVVRTSGDPVAIASDVRRIIRSIDARQPVSHVTSMAGHLSDILATERFSAALMVGLASLGLFLAACGLYGVMSYAVSQRTAELGLRIALGAGRRAVLWLVMRQALALVAIGLVVGFVLARALGETLSTSLFGIGVHDPTTFTVVAVVLVGVSAAACYLPAARAIRVDPVVAMKAD